MRTYRNGWALTVTVLVALAFAVAVRVIGWIPPVVVLLSMASVGALFGVVLQDDDPEARRRAMVRLALWLGLGSVLLVGLTPVVGRWVVLLVVVLGGLAPDVLERCLAWRSAHRPPVVLPALEDVLPRARATVARHDGADQVDGPPRAGRARARRPSRPAARRAPAP